ncbi:hypothetical protein [Streptomyces sp. NPDC004721]
MSDTTGRPDWSRMKPADFGRRIKPDQKALILVDELDAGGTDALFPVDEADDGGTKVPGGLRYDAAPLWADQDGKPPADPDHPGH